MVAQVFQIAQRNTKNLQDETPELMVVKASAPGK